jgi:hypothetical protein
MKVAGYLILYDNQCRLAYTTGWHWVGLSTSDRLCFQRATRHRATKSAGSLASRRGADHTAGHPLRSVAYHSNCQSVCILR